VEWLQGTVMQAAPIHFILIIISVYQRPLAVKKTPPINHQPKPINSLYPPQSSDSTFLQNDHTYIYLSIQLPTINLATGIKKDIEDGP